MRLKSFVRSLGHSTKHEHLLDPPQRSPCYSTPGHSDRNLSRQNTRDGGGGPTSPLQTADDLRTHRILSRSHLGPPRDTRGTPPVPTSTTDCEPLPVNPTQSPDSRRKTFRYSGGDRHPVSPSLGSRFPPPTLSSLQSDQVDFRREGPVVKWFVCVYRGVEGCPFRPSVDRTRPCSVTVESPKGSQPSSLGLQTIRLDRGPLFGSVKDSKTPLFHNCGSGLGPPCS